VNHPSILFWDNGNEGGWNTEVDGEFAKYDPQQRVVLHPWEKHGGINTKHYPKYNDLVKLLASGDLVMPTEFLHGLYDGGHGAGLANYWQLMSRYKNACGGFLWVLADEGVVRCDSNNVMDVKGNWAPDGIVGPYREKEASFYTIRYLWSPIEILDRDLELEGAFSLANRYSFTDANQCRFTWQLRDFLKPQETGAGYKVIAEGVATAPHVPPGGRGKLQLTLPAGWRKAHALALRVDDPTGHELWTWVWPAADTGPLKGGSVAKITAAETSDAIDVQNGDLKLRFSKQSGQLLFATRRGQTFSLANGPRMLGGTATLASIKHHMTTNKVVITANYTGNLQSVIWAIGMDGWVDLSYRYDLRGTNPCHGVGFDLPEASIKDMRWFGYGPFRVWQNRIAGSTLGVWTNTYNNTITGWPGSRYP
jgi:hypothetical protein